MSARAAGLAFDTLTVEQDRRVLTATFADPPNHFLSLRLIKDLDRLSRAVDRDPTVGAVILTGTGDKFVSHSEPEQVSQFFEMSAPPVPTGLARWSIRMNNAAMRLPRLRELTEKHGGEWGSGIVYSALLKRTMLRMNRSGVVYIAAVNGAALGGGFELALFCDLRIAGDAEHVRIGLIEILAGLIPGGGGSQRLRELIGVGAALEHMLEGRPLSAQEASDIGVIHRVAPAADLLADAQRTGARIARRTPYAVSALKRAVYFGGHRSLSASLDFELAQFISTGRNPHKRVVAEAFSEDVDRLGDSPFVADPEPWIAGTRGPGEPLA